MLPADYPFNLQPRRQARRRLRPGLVLAVSASLIVHGLVLLGLLAPAEPMPPAPRSTSSDRDAMQVFLLEPRDRQALSTMQVLPTMVVEWAAPAEPEREGARRRTAPAAPSIEEHSDTTKIAGPSAAQLFGAIESTAHEVTAADRKPASTGLPGATVQLPGRAEPIIDLPVRFKKRPTPKQITEWAARIVFSTMANNSDDLESAREMRNPLQDLTDAHIRGVKEPECNDPDDPLRDPRCWKPPE